MNKNERNKAIQNIERRIYLIDQELEKQKGKRTILMLVINIVITGIIIFSATDALNEGVSAIFDFAIMSVVLGTVTSLWVVCGLSFVTALFTNIHNLQDQMDFLQKELYRLKHTEDSEDFADYNHRISRQFFDDD